MKAYIQFVSDYENNSPVLEIEVSNKTSIKNLLARFRSKHTLPTSVMIDFVIFACAATGSTNAKIINESDVSSNRDIQIIETRKPNVVEFVYKKDDGKTDWRKIDIIEEDKFYIKGHDLNDNNSFKSFKKENIVGGRMIKI